MKSAEPGRLRYGADYPERPQGGGSWGNQGFPHVQNQGFPHVRTTGFPHAFQPQLPASLESVTASS